MKVRLAHLQQILSVKVILLNLLMTVEYDFTMLMMMQYNG